MESTQRQFIWSRKKTALTVSTLVLAGLLIPWLLQDPNYKILARVPLATSAPAGILIEQQHHLITRRESDQGRLYITQYTFQITNERQQDAHGVRVRLKGIDESGRTLFSAIARPPVLDIPAGKQARAFVRAKDLGQDQVQKLRQLIVTLATTPSSRLR